MRLAHLLLTAAIAVTATACAADEPEATPAFEVVTEASITPGDDVPAPSGEIVLTITGDIDVTNDGNSLAFDMATLEELGTVAYTVDDAQALGREVRFTGVLLSDVLAVAGAADDATTLHTVALNDYAVDIPVQDAADYPVLIATAADGDRMPVDAYGPVRVVYPYHAFDLDPVEYDPRWNWQLAEIDVR